MEPNFSLSPIFSQLPTLSSRNIAFRITAEAESAIRGGSPWLFESSIKKQSHEGKAGDWGVLYDRKNRFLAIGLYDPKSPIRVRILQLKQGKIEKEWFKEKFEEAVSLRSGLLETKTNGYRLINGENDGFPGFILDCYDQTYVLKLYTSAWLPHLALVLEALSETVVIKRLVLRLARSLEKECQNLPIKDGYFLFGEAEPLVFKENGLLFEVDPILGHKTGFFLDQRENRAQVEKLAKGKKVLNVFAYTGGFSLYAARGGACSVVSLDISKPALAAAKRNFALNLSQSMVQNCSHTIMVADAFQALKEMKQRGESFDFVILDPPAFAKKKSEVERALQAYRRLIRAGLNVLEPGGIFVVASCSRQISADLFFTTLFEEIQQEGRTLKELERTGHALDHPVNFSEGAYLKCFFGEIF